MSPRTLHMLIRLTPGRALLLAALLVSCVAVRQDGAPEWKAISLPVITDTIALRVLVVTNPRFPQLSEEGIRKLLDASAENVRRYFGIDVRFSEPEHRSIEAFFSVLPKRVMRERAAEIVDTRTLTQADYDRMRASLRGTLENYSGERDRVIDYAMPYLEEIPAQRDFEQLSQALVHTLISRLQYWQKQQAADGSPVLDGTPFNEWVWWDSIGYGDLPYDVVVTNQLVASAEYYAMDVHSAIRGGITAGTTSFSRASGLQAFSWVTLYPLLNESGLLNLLRNDNRYGDDQVVEYGAALLTHELGHLLLHLGHPFGSEACIMSPMPLLKYREWTEKLDPALCPLGSEEQMRPGIASVDYRVDLLE